MMNKLTIKLAGRQAQGMAFSHPFIEAQKKKPDEGIPAQVISGSFQGTVGFQVRKGWKKKRHAFIRMRVMM